MSSGKPTIGRTDLAIILYSSPLPPSATLRRLREIFELKDCSEVLEIAKQDEVQGVREGLKNFVENQLDTLKVAVENTEVLLQQLSELMMIFTVSLPLIVAGLLFMLSPREGVFMLLVFSVVGVFVGVVGFTRVPPELRFPIPDRRVYLPLALLAIPFLLDALHVAELGENAFLVAAAMALPSAYLVYVEEGRLLRELEENEEMLLNALRCPFHLYRCLGLESLERPVRLAVSRTVRAALLLMGRFGAEPQGLRWLLEYYKQFSKLMRDVRSRTMIALLNGVIGVAVLAVGLALISSVFSSLPAVNMAGLNISPESFTAIKPYMNIVLAVNSLSYSVATASVREGNPLYFPLYLPAMLLATYAGLQLGPLILPHPG